MNDKERYHAALGEAENDDGFIIPREIGGKPVRELTREFLETLVGIKNATKVIIPDSVTFIGGWAFDGCERLKIVIIPDSVTSIGDSAFWRCKSLTSVVTPESVTLIGDNAFLGCESLTSVVIPNSVTSIGDRAFWGCKSLTSVVIPASVKLGKDVFPDKRRVVRK